MGQREGVLGARAMRGRTGGLRYERGWGQDLRMKGFEGYRESEDLGVCGGASGEGAEEEPGPAAAEQGVCGMEDRAE